MNRLARNGDWKSLAYNSYTFGDPATPMPRGYLGDPTKFRVMHAGTEMFHVYHLHGGGIRWRYDPVTDHSFNYADTGLNKHPKVGESDSSRLDSQSEGPGESFNMEIEGGAGGVQQSAGDFLFHCHIAEHYVSGMWSFWRVYDTLQPDLKPLPDRAAPPKAVDSDQLIGRTMPDGTTLTKDNLADWIRPQIPTQGVPQNLHDGSVWDWTVDNSDPAAPVYLGAPEDTSTWPDLRNEARTSGRAARRHLRRQPAEDPVRPGQRAPGVPAAATQHRRPCALLPQRPQRRAVARRERRPGQDRRRARPVGRPPRRDLPEGRAQAHVQHRVARAADPGDPGGRDGPAGQDLRAGPRRARHPGRAQARAAAGHPRQPGRLHRGHAHQPSEGQRRVAVLDDEHPHPPRPVRRAGVRRRRHRHALRPGRAPLRARGQPAGRRRPHGRHDAAAELRRQVPRRRLDRGRRGHRGHRDPPDQESSTPRRTRSLSPRRSTSRTPAAPGPAPSSCSTAGIPTWCSTTSSGTTTSTASTTGATASSASSSSSRPGSTYHDPKSGAEVDSGTYVDIHSTNPLAPGVAAARFRELALWTIDENPATDSTLNLRSTPFADRPRRPVAAVQLLQMGRSEHAVAHRLRRRPVRRAHGQRRARDRHAAPLRAPVPHRPALHGLERQARGHADRHAALRRLGEVHGDPRRRRRRPAAPARATTCTTTASTGACARARGA